MKRKHPARPADDARQHARARRAELDRVVTTQLLFGQVFSLLRSGGRGLQSFVSLLPKAACQVARIVCGVGKLGSHIGKLGSERGDDQLVMIDDCLAICGRFERRLGLEGMCGGHPAGHHADRVMGPGFFVVPSGG